MKKDSPKKIFIMAGDEVLQEFENAYIDSLNDDQLVITYYSKSIMYKITINLDADVITRVDIQEE